MAVNEHTPITAFEQWYTGYDATGGRQGELAYRDLAPCAVETWRQYERFKTEMDQRVGRYSTLERLADGEVISPKPDLPNVSSGETAGLIRRIARNLVQNTPNVEILSKFDDDSLEGVFSRYVLFSKVIGSDEYSNDMQQNLFSSTKTALTLGFACVIPVLLQDGGGNWFIKYDTVHYRDVFPEPGCKDIRTATKVYVRRYLTKGEAVNLILGQAPGWDTNALRAMIQTRPPSREQQSVDHQTKKHHQIPDGYEVITCYTDDGSNFITFEGRSKMLLRIEKNKHPLKQHPVHFLVLEKDDQQPLGKSQVELLIGRQDFQDLMLNGAMKSWYRNINPSIIGYGAPNALPNLSPGKYTPISNPNAKIEAFEVNTQTLMQYGTISQQNLGSMVSMIGAADQQMATQAGNGMSATPQGVEAQQAMVDITTNNYQKAIEAFFSHYCSYALTLYFQELRAVKKVKPTAESRVRLLKLGLDEEKLNEDGTLDVDFDTLATEYWVRCIPGSLTELEDEKQLRILNQLFVPLSQALPAMAATQDQRMLTQMTAAMAYIVEKQIELSGSSSSRQIKELLTGGDLPAVMQQDERIQSFEDALSGLGTNFEEEMEQNAAAIAQLQQNQQQMTRNMELLLQKLGVTDEASGSSSPSNSGDTRDNTANPPSGPTVVPASA